MINYIETNFKERLLLAKRHNYFSENGNLYEAYEYGQLVGRIQIKDNFIYMIEVYKKNKGIGTRIIADFLEKHRFLKGASLIDSIDFWIKLGAKFIDDISNYNYDEYPEFIITKKSFAK